jgi:alpha-beta hydrolase superfamily lysophospholipase
MDDGWDGGVRRPDMTAIPVWFGPATRPLFGWFHAPADRQARGGVVVCPPFIREHLQAHYTLRLLAEQLEARGMSVVRFDYDGMGDSAGTERDPGRLAAWVRSIRAAMDLLSTAGVADVSLVGMRIGALLAVQAAAAHADVSQLVLWDPCVSGRAYLHEQSAVTSLALRGNPHAPDGSLDSPGVHLSRETVEALGALGMATITGPVARRLLVLTRDDRDRSEETMSHLGSAAAEHRVAVGQAELMDAGMPLLQIPHALIAEVADWLEDGAPAGWSQVDAPAAAGRAIVGTTPSGQPIVEYPLFVPPAQLFGMVTEVTTTPAPGPAAAFINVSNGHHVGPNRMWVDLARRWAGHGIRSVRFDLSGLGDSPVRTPEQEQFVARAPEAFSDVADVARAISPDDPGNVLLVGHCASAYQALDSGLELGVAGVAALNPVLSFAPPELERQRPLDPHRRVALPRTPIIQSFHGTDAPLSWVRKRFPGLGWRLRLWSHPRRRPGSWLPTLIGQGTDVLVITGEREDRPFRMGVRRRLQARLERTGRLRIEHWEELEHGLLLGAQRTMVTDLLTEHVVSRFGAGPAIGGSASPPRTAGTEPTTAPLAVTCVGAARVAVTRVAAARVSAAAVQVTRTAVTLADQQA